MLTPAEVLDLAHRQDGVPTLTAYIAVPPDMPHAVAAVGAQLRHEISHLRAQLVTATHAERTAFEHCAAALLGSAARGVHRQGGGTWVGFVGVNGNAYDEMLAAPVPTCVLWERGVRIAPYLAVCSERDALVVILDRMHARFFHYARGVLTELETFETVEPFETGPHMGAPPRRGFHAGTRGEPHGEVAARHAEAAFQHHIARAADRIGVRAYDDKWIVLGGSAEAVARVAARATSRCLPRMGFARNITAAATPAQIRTAAGAAVHALTQAHQLRIVRDVLMRGDVVVRGVAGVRVLALQRAMATLAMSTHWMRTNAADAERIVRDARAHGAVVEIVDGDAALLLNGSAGGIVAIPRFPLADSAVLAGVSEATA